MWLGVNGAAVSGSGLLSHAPLKWMHPTGCTTKKLLRSPP